MDKLLESPTLLLRPLEPEDLTLMYLLENDTTLWHCSSTTQPYSHNTLRQFIDSTESDIYKEHQLRLVIQKKATESTESQGIGFVDLTDFNPRHARAEVGIALLQSHRGQGIATEALQLLELYAREVLSVRGLYAYVSEDNLSGRKLFERCGFARSGTLTDWVKQADRFLAVDIFQKIL